MGEYSGDIFLNMSIIESKSLTICSCCMSNMTQFLKCLKIRFILILFISSYLIKTDTPPEPRTADFFLVLTKSKFI